MILPWQVDVPQDNRPIANWLIVLACVVVFTLQMEGATENGSGGLDAWVLKGWSLKGLVGYMWLHGSFIHLFGNLWFLWVFGNAVCANVGNLRYPLVYVTLGVAAGVAYLMTTSGSVIGASGAINGIVGMYLVMFPLNEITCYYAFWLMYWHRFEIRGFWLILFWLFWDILGAVRWGDSGVAYVAHVGGFAAGVGLGILFCVKGWCLLDEYDRSLVQIWQDHRKRNDGKPVDPTPSTLGFTPEYSPAFEGTEESKPPVLRRLSIPMLDLNDGTPVPEAESCLACDCGERIVLSERYAGKTVRCPRCREPIQVPSDLGQDPDNDRKSKPKQSGVDAKHRSGIIRFVCPCGQKIKIPARYGGRFGKCPRCNGRLRIPSS